MSVTSRKKFIRNVAAGITAPMLLPFLAFANEEEFKGAVVSEDEGEIYYLRDGTAKIKIKISKVQGSGSMSFLSESFRPGDAIPVHKHLNEDEFIFIHQDTGLLLLGDAEHAVSAGSVAIVPKGIWHRLKNTGNEILEMQFGYTPSGFEGYFRELGAPPGQPIPKRTLKEHEELARKWGMMYRW